MQGFKKPRNGLEIVLLLKNKKMKEEKLKDVKIGIVGIGMVGGALKKYFNFSSVFFILLIIYQIFTQTNYLASKLHLQ